VNDFMMKNFEPIMDIEFTANFESYLDKIAIGDANWVTVLRTFYDMFNPIVEKLSAEAKVIKNTIGSSSDILLGEDNDGNAVYKGSGKYGPYVKIADSEDSKKWKFAPLKEIDINTVTLETALELLEFPKFIGKIGNTMVHLSKGQYGLYFKYGDRNI